LEPFGAPALHATHGLSQSAGRRRQPEGPHQYLYHLGVKPVARSTFVDANSQGPASFFDPLFAVMYRRWQPLAPKHKICM
jgi:hypothetical protein